MVSRRLLRIKVLKELFGFLNAKSTSIGSAEKNLVFSINKTYDLYHHLLLLVASVADYGRQQLELGKLKKRPTEEEKNPNTKFVDNTFIELISKHKALNEYCDKHRLSWQQTPELAKKLYTSLLDSDYYATYMAKVERSFEEDKTLIIRFYERELEDSEDLQALLEEQSIYWIDDLEFVLSQVIKTFKSFSQTTAPLMPLYKDADDEQFARQLLLLAATNSAEYQELIDKHTQNWDVERIAFMDIVIMITAIAEIVEFQTIPIKVSLNEYIEIAKYYSTPNSSIFINGVLDKVVADLKVKNMVVKTGRGLVDSR